MAPDGLPCTIHQFIRQALNMEDNMALLCWTVLKDLAWDTQECVPHPPESPIPLFLQHNRQAPIFEPEPAPLSCSSSSPWQPSIISSFPSASAVGQSAPTTPSTNSLQ